MYETAPPLPPKTGKNRRQSLNSNKTHSSVHSNYSNVSAVSSHSNKDLANYNNSIYGHSLQKAYGERPTESFSEDCILLNKKKRRAILNESSPNNYQGYHNDGFHGSGDLPSEPYTHVFPHDRPKSAPPLDMALESFHDEHVSNRDYINSVWQDPAPRKSQSFNISTGDAPNWNYLESNILVKKSAPPLKPKPILGSSAKREPFTQNVYPKEVLKSAKKSGSLEHVNYWLEHSSSFHDLTTLDDTDTWNPYVDDPRYQTYYGAELNKNQQVLQKKQKGILVLPPAAIAQHHPSVHNKIQLPINGVTVAESHDFPLRDDNLPITLIL